MPSSPTSSCAFMLEASRVPHLQGVVRRWRASFQDSAAAALAATGSTDPAMDARLLIATMDGLLLEHLATGDQTLGEATETAVDRLLSPRASDSGRAKQG